MKTRELIEALLYYDMDSVVEIATEGGYVCLSIVERSLTEPRIVADEKLFQESDVLDAQDSVKVSG